MSRSPPVRAPRRGGRKRPAHAQMLLDPIAQDALRLLALTFQRCGYAPEQVISAFSSYMKNPPPSVSADQRNPELELHDAGHVLTLWNSDPDYVDDEGKPRPIPARGAAPSIEALAMRVRSTLRFEDVLGILERTRAVRKKARLYVPLDDTVLHAPDSKTQSVHHLLVLNQLLHNFEFNSRRALGTASWPQRVADCPDFPEDELPAFIARFTELARRFMTARDRDMARIARKAGPAIARVRPEINLFLTVAPTMEEARKKRSP